MERSLLRRREIVRLVAEKSGKKESYCHTGG